MLFVIRSFTKPQEKVKYRINIFWNFFLLCYLFKILANDILANFVTFKAHDLSKAFNKIVVVMIKRILWVRASCL